MTQIDVRLRTEWVGKIGYRYDVLLDGAIIVRRSRDPEHDAARVLHARGLRGRFRTIDFRTGKPRMILDIEKAATLRTVERNDSGLIVVPYRPMSEEDKTRARLHRAHQGRLSTGGVAPDNLDVDPGRTARKDLSSHPVSVNAEPKVDSIATCCIATACLKRVPDRLPCQGRALHRLDTSDDGRPEMVPVALEGPPIPQVPDALKAIHFNDPLVYVIAAAQEAGPHHRPN